MAIRPQSQTQGNAQAVIERWASLSNLGKPDFYLEDAAMRKKKEDDFEDDENASKGEKKQVHIVLLLSLGVLVLTAVLNYTVLDGALTRNIISCRDPHIVLKVKDMLTQRMLQRSRVMKRILGVASNDDYVRGDIDPSSIETVAKDGNPDLPSDVICSCKAKLTVKSNVSVYGVRSLENSDEYAIEYMVIENEKGEQYLKADVIDSM
jgi:hypothetical protein